MGRDRVKLLRVSGRMKDQQYPDIKSLANVNRFDSPKRPTGQGCDDEAAKA